MNTCNRRFAFGRLALGKQHRAHPESRIRLNLDQQLRRVHTGMHSAVEREHRVSVSPGHLKDTRFQLVLAKRALPDQVVRSKRYCVLVFRAADHDRHVIRNICGRRIERVARQIMAVHRLNP
jgi:hypothetical protein